MVIMTKIRIKKMVLITLENIKPLVILFHSVIFIKFSHFFGYLITSLINNPIVTINPIFQKVTSSMNNYFDEPSSYEDVISYAPFWNTLKKKKLSQYDLVNKLYISSSMLQKLRKDQPLTLKSIAMLCLRLNIHPSDIFILCPDRKKPAII